MRTTVAIDPDVQLMLRAAMKERGLSFKDALNLAVRAGLSVPTYARSRFVQRSFAMGAARSFRWDKALAAADAIEDEELRRTIAFRK